MTTEEKLAMATLLLEDATKRIKEQDRMLAEADDLIRRAKEAILTLQSLLQ